MDLEKLISAYETHKNDPVALTDLEVQLAGLSYHLGERQVEALTAFQGAYNTLKVDKVSIEDAKARAGVRTGNEHDRLKLAIEAVDRLIWSLRDRVKVLDKESRTQ